MDELTDVFTIRARRCKRCGGLLTSAQAVLDGYGHTCKMKQKQEELARMPDPNQMTIFNFIDKNESEE